MSEREIVQSARRCGDCQLCCYVMPTAEIELPANTRCEHQCRKGCAIYARRPFSCRAFSCQWLIGVDVGRRPDRTHMVVDPLPDFVTAVPDGGGEPVNIAVVQVWVDPRYPDAHRDPAFRRWLDSVGKFALIRYGSDEGFLLAPPSRTGGQWVEQGTSKQAAPAHTLADVLDAVGGQLDDIDIVIKD